MKKHSIRIYFGRDTQADFLHIAGEIITKMTENASFFPNLPVPLAQVKKERDAYQAAYDSSEHSGRTGEIRNTRKVLEESLHSNGKYVNDLADGDLAILEKSGYPMAKEPSPVGDLSAPAWLHVVALAGGGFSFDVAIVPNYWGYMIAITEASNPESDFGKWETRWSPVPYSEFKSGFKSGVKYKFAACAVASSFNLSWVRGNDELFSQ